MNRHEAEELLPWFVAGTLSREEAAAVQAFIDSGEISQRELEEVALFAESVIAQRADEPAYDPAILKRAMTQLEVTPQQAPDEPLVVREPQAQPSTPWWQALSRRLQWSLTPPLAKFAIGAQFAAVLALGALLYANVAGVDEAAVYGTVSGTTAAVQADVDVLFAPGVSEADVRAWLLSLDARVVDGPSAMGVYKIALPAGTVVVDVLPALQAAPITAYVKPVAR